MRKMNRHAVEVIDLMLEAAREQFFAVHLKPLAVLILGADAHLGRAHHLLANVGKAEAAFLFVDLALAGDDLGVDDYQLLLGVLAPAQVDDREALGHADLLRGQSGALRGVHGLKHVRGQLAQFGVEFGDRFAGLLTAPARDISQSLESSSLLKAPYLFDVSVENFVSFPATESPPNFCWAWAATVSATMASATTPAAGTTQISLRS
jgi:hypothetical protein